MGNFSWVHLILAIFIIIFTTLGYPLLVIIFAAIIAVLSVFGVCSYKPGYHSKKEVKPVIKSSVKKKK